jgi:hypothetical protein
MSTDKRVDDYIKTLPLWQQTVCREIRQLVHVAEPHMIETIKFTNRPYFVLDGNVCALLAAKDHVNVFIYDPIVPDPEHIINQGQQNTTARAIQICEGQTLGKEAFIALIKAVVANNRAGGWRKVKSL